MMRSMYSGVSGLKNHQVRMDVIGNNIANVNTAGYKKSRVVFKDSLYQNLRGATSPVEGGRGGTNPMGIGLGMAVSSVDQIHSGSPTTTTNKVTDMAIDGDGYFVLRNGQQEYYTRAGAFDWDDYGSLVSANGYKVQGWVTEIDPNTGEWNLNCSGDVESINISGFKTCEPQATKNMNFSGNLDADTPYYEVQTLTFPTDITGGTAGGHFRLSFDGENSNWIAVGADTASTAANIQSALENMPNIGSDNVAVSWNSTNNNYEIKFQGDLASRDVADISFTAGPTTVYAEVEETTSGETGTTDEEQALIVNGDAGSYVLSYNGEDVGTFLFNAPAGDIQTALQTTTGELVTVGGGPGPGTYTITFPNSMGDVNNLVATPVLTVAQTTPGETGTTDEVQTLTIPGTVGSYVLSYNGVETGAIAHNAVAADIQAALQAITGLGGVTVAASAVPGADWDITFPNSMGDVNMLVATPFTQGFDGGTGTVALRALDATVYPTTVQESIIKSRDVWDSLGNKETLYFRFFKYDIEEGNGTTSRTSTWACDISLNNPLFEEAVGYDADNGFSDADLSTDEPVGTLTAGSSTPQIFRLLNLQFDDSGKVVGGSPDLDPVTLTIERGAVGAEDIVFEIDPSTLTQFAGGGGNATNVVQDGYGKGSLRTFSVGVDGTITGGYDNGETRSLARVALARFENPAGMVQVGGTIFQESGNSGEPNIGAPALEGMGDIVPNSLEMSNVDLSEEFTDMIVTQRGFQANSRIITTSDEMIQELVNLKR